MHDRAAARDRRVAASIVVVLALAGTGLQLTAAPHATEASAQPAPVAPGPATPELIERAVERGELSAARGALVLTWALTAPARVPAAFVSDTPWSGTLALLRLREQLAALGRSPAAAAARTALRGRSLACPGASGSLPDTRSTPHFYLQYDRSRLPSLPIGAYSSALETSWTTQIGRFGWAAPPKDPGRSPPNGRYPVRLQNLGPGLYGFVSRTGVARDNPATPWKDRDAAASCMVLNRDYAPFPGSPLGALRATAAHELNHSIQFGYGALAGFGSVTDVMVEGLATEMEDEVFDSSDDSYNYLWPTFTKPLGRYNGSPYPAWIVFRAMTERFGVGERNGSEAVFQRFWEQISKGASTNLAALAKALKAERTTLSAAYHDAAIALRFLVDCDAAPRAYCLGEGPAYARAAGGNDDHAVLGPGPDALERSIPNDLALNWIGLPTPAGPLDLTVTHRRGRGILRVAIACRAGGDVSVIEAGSATASGNATARNADLSGCDEATAVISNVKQTSPTPASITETGYRIRIA